MKLNLKKILLFLLSVFTGLIFIYSGYTKLHPIEPFEFTFVDLGIGGWQTAPFLARCLIGLEFLIGILMISGVRVKQTALITIGTLLMFSVYLIFILIKEGNNGNCGCFGNAIVMTPVQALIKNVFLLVISFMLFKFYEGFDYRRFGVWLILLFSVASLSMPHVLNYVDFDYSASYLVPKENFFKLELDSLYKDAKLNVPPKNLKNGKHVLAFMSMSCPHCRIAAKKMRIMKEKNPGLPIYFILNGDNDKIKPFFDDTKARNIKFCILNGKNFVYLAGLNMPTIYLLNNSVVENKVNYMELDQREVEKWLSK
ncbi:MAG: MauE/DoxX family redox-associated membrane protein [Bacteroidota bacterium]